MKKTNNKGFSLVELIIVIAIMAILIGVLAPQYIKYVEKSRKSADEDNADALKNAAMTACTDDEYIDGIKAGDKIYFSQATGVKVVATTGSLESGLNEYFSKYKSCKVKSKVYKGKKYVVEIVDGKSSALKATGEWK